MLTNYSACKLLKYGYQNLISIKKSLGTRNNLFISIFSEKKLQKVPDFVSIRCSSFFHSGARPLPRLIEKLSNFIIIFWIS